MAVQFQHFSSKFACICHHSGHHSRTLGDTRQWLGRNGAQQEACLKSVVSRYQTVLNIFDDEVVEADVERYNICQIARFKIFKAWFRAGCRGVEVSSGECLESRGVVPNLQRPTSSCRPSHPRLLPVQLSSPHFILHPHRRARHVSRRSVEVDRWSRRHSEPAGARTRAVSRRIGSDRRRQLTQHGGE